MSAARTPTARLLTRAARHPKVIAFAESNQLGARGGRATDYAVARFMGVSPQQVSGWRHGRGMSGDTIIELCGKLNLAWGEFWAWYCDIHAARDRLPGGPARWRKLKRYALYEMPVRAEPMQVPS